MSAGRARVLVLLGALEAAAVAGAFAEEVAYELTIAQGPIEIGGRTTVAMTINGAIPGPILRFTEGDDAVIRVHNAMPVDTSLHWHGILLPNPEDGVPT